MGKNTPKQYLEVDGKPIIRYAVERFINTGLIDAYIFVVAQEWRSYLDSLLEDMRIKVPVHYAEPGETRQFSIYHALQVAMSHYHPEDTVIIHDAARPSVSERLIADCIQGCETHDAVLPVLPMKDTVYQSVDGMHISTLLPRHTLFAGQAPEAFKLGKYMRAHESCSHEELALVNGSTELAYKAGMSVKLIPGDEMNFKITTPEDLIRFKMLVER